MLETGPAEHVIFAALPPAPASGTMPPAKQPRSTADKYGLRSDAS
jgi:hypothetical protein